MWELDYKEIWVQKNWCFWTVALEKTLESPLDCKEIQPVHPKRRSVLGVHWKDWCWSWNSNTLATWCKELTHLKRPWCWERLRAEGEGDDRGWDGWMALLTQWTWVWVNSSSWWWTGRPGVLRFMRSQRVGHDWVTELDWTELKLIETWDWCAPCQIAIIICYILLSAITIDVLEQRFKSKTFSFGSTITTITKNNRKEKLPHG